MHIANNAFLPSAFAFLLFSMSSTGVDGMGLRHDEHFNNNNNNNSNLHEQDAGTRTSQASSPTSEDVYESGAACRWMFGAKYLDGTDLTKVEEALKGLVTSCPGYASAGFGQALPGTSSYYDISVYVDSLDCDKTFEQAGCMVSVLESDPSLAEPLMTTLFDAAEISIANLTSTALVSDGDVIETHFLRFRDMTQRKWLSQRTSFFLEMAPKLGGFNISDIQGGGTAFPSEYLSAWPNDVHFGATLNLGGGDSLDAVAKFWRYVISSPHKDGNNFLPNAQNVMEMKSILYKAQSI